MIPSPSPALHLYRDPRIGRHSLPSWFLAADKFFTFGQLCANLGGSGHIEALKKQQKTTISEINGDLGAHSVGSACVRFPDSFRSYFSPNPAASAASMPPGVGLLLTHTNERSKERQVIDRASNQTNRTEPNRTEADLT